MLLNKTVYRPYLLLLILVLILTACQVELAAEEDVCKIDAVTGEYAEDCLPVETESDAQGAAYPVEEMIIIVGDQAAYPITEEDLSQLYKTWRLTTYAEDGVESMPPARLLTFNGDGSYSIAAESDIQTGTWTSDLLAAESNLVFNPGTDQEQRYQIIILDETELKLRTWQENTYIDEGYQPENSD